MSPRRSSPCPTTRAVAEDGAAVGDAEELVELVRDEDDPPPLGGERAQDVREGPPLGRRQRRRRLVKDEQVARRGRAASGSRPAGVTPTERSSIDRRRARRRARTTRELAHLARPRVGRGTASGGPGRSPSATFSATVMSGTSMKCWCTIPIPSSSAWRGLSIVTGCPSTSIGPRVRLEEAVDDVHQRRLAGAVLAEQAEDLAVCDVEGDVVVRGQLAVALRESAEAEEGRCRVSNVRRRAGHVHSIGASPKCEIPASIAYRTQSRPATAGRARRTSDAPAVAVVERRLRLR